MNFSGWLKVLPVHGVMVGGAFLLSATPIPGGLPEKERQALALIGEEFWKDLKTGNLVEAAESLDPHSQRGLAHRFRLILGQCAALVPEEELPEFYALDADLDEALKETDPIKFFGSVTVGVRGKKLQPLLLEAFWSGPALLAVAGAEDTGFLVFGYSYPGAPEGKSLTLITMRAAREDSRWRLELPRPVFEQIGIGTYASEFLKPFPGGPELPPAAEVLPAPSPPLSASGFPDPGKQSVVRAAAVFWENLKDGTLGLAAERLDPSSALLLADWSRAVFSDCLFELGFEKAALLFGFPESMHSAEEFSRWSTRATSPEFLDRIRFANKGLEFHTMLLDRFMQGPRLLAVMGSGAEAFLIFGHKGSSEPAYVPDQLLTLRAAKTGREWRFHLPPDMLSKSKIDFEVREFLKTL